AATSLLALLKTASLYVSSLAKTAIANHISNQDAAVHNLIKIWPLHNGQRLPYSPSVEPLTREALLPSSLRLRSMIFLEQELNHKQTQAICGPSSLRSMISE